MLYITGQPGSPDNNESKKSRETGSAGLDLSFKRDDDDHESENDKDELVANDDEERNEESDDGNGSKQSYPGATNGGRSRRKPAAPQWVNPEWSGDTEQDVEMKQDEPEDDRTINGVCVVNSGLAGHLASLSSPSYTINNSH